MSTAERTDDRDRWHGYGPPYGWHYGWHVWQPGFIVLMILGFIFWWPLGLAFLAFMIWSRGMGCYGTDRWHRKIERMEEKMGRMRERMSGFGAPPSSGNHAFDEYRTETLRRLEEEQREFRDFLERLRFAKDKAEFDQFMAERRNRQTPEAPRPQS